MSRRLLLLAALAVLLLPAAAWAATTAPEGTDPAAGQPHADSAQQDGTFPPADASTGPTVQRRFQPEELERELMCPTCNSPLYLSQSPAANRIRAYVIERADAGWTKQQVLDALEDDFGPAILASPKAEGIGLAAWLVPLLAVAAGLAVAVGLALVWRRRSRGGGPPAGGTEAGALEPDLEARVDEALARFD